MAQFRKKPTVIDAWRYIGVPTEPDNQPTSETDAYASTLVEELGAPLEPSGCWGDDNAGARKWELLVRTPTGPSTLNVGDWLARQPLPEPAEGWDWWPIAADIFDGSYEPVEV